MPALGPDFQLKDVFNPRSVGALALRIKSAWGAFQSDAFTDGVVAEMPALGFLERAHLIRDRLTVYLPPDFPTAVGILVAALGPPTPDDDLAAWDSFVVMAECAFVSKYGAELDAKGRPAHFDIAMSALYEMTQRFSAEGDLRTFIELDFEAAMAILRRWCTDPSPHVRRLVSEGTRPRLPLAGRIRRFQSDPSPVLDLLEQLHADPSEYVRRSVANNINDISKDNSDIALATLSRWSAQNNPEVQWVVRHAARSLIKDGHPEAVALLGYSSDIALELTEMRVTPEVVTSGEKAQLSFTIRSVSNERQPLLIDYALYFKKANGSLVPKVFKLRTLVLQARQSIVIQRSISLKPTSGRTIYPGEHAVELQINGVRMPERAVFTVEMSR